MAKIMKTTRQSSFIQFWKPKSEFKIYRNLICSPIVLLFHFYTLNCVVPVRKIIIEVMEAMVKYSFSKFRPESAITKKCLW